MEIATSKYETLIIKKENEDGLSYISIESIDKELDEIVEKLIKYQN
jgi:hypothetical protein